MAKNNKIPKWVLFDQIHIDVTIRTDLTAAERKDLKDLLESKTLASLFQMVIVGPHRNKIQVKVNK